MATGQSQRSASRARYISIGIAAFVTAAVGSYLAFGDRTRIAARPAP